MRFAMRLLAMGAVAAGVLLVLHSLGLVIWQYLGLVEARAWTPLPARLWFVDQTMLANSATAPVLPFIPEWRWPWLIGHQAAGWVLDRLHIAVLPAALGALLVWGGGHIVRRQTDAIRLARQQKEDRLRRARLYRREHPPEDPRKEPALNA